MTDGQPFTFTREHDGSLTLESAVYQALGAASVCWENPGGAGFFDSTRAKEIGEELLAFIRANTLSRPAQTSKHNPDAYLVKDPR